MKHRIAFALAAAIAQLALVTVSSQAGTTLRYKFVAGQVLRYNFTTTTSTSVQANMPGADQMPDIPMTMTGVMRNETVKVLPNGDAEIKVTFEGMNMNLMGDPQPVDISKVPVITMTMSPRGEVKKTNGLDKVSAAFGTGTPLDNVGGLMPNSAFPSKELNVGDKWTQNVPFPMGGKLLVNAQLAGADAGTATVKQKISGNVNVSNTMPSDLIKMNSQGTMSMDGSVLFSTADGYMLRSDASGSMLMTATAPDAGGDMKFITKIQATLELIPTALAPQ